jgi:hypothetical protein
LFCASSTPLLQKDNRQKFKSGLKTNSSQVSEEDTRQEFKSGLKTNSSQVSEEDNRLPGTPFASYGTLLTVYYCILI